jgi:hypothetical protein
MWTVELPVWAMWAADHQLASGDGEAITWHSNLALNF